MHRWQPIPGEGVVTCVKCGHSDKHNGYWSSQVRHSLKYWWPGGIGCQPHDRKDEHLDVTCGVCGYCWAAPCADAVPA